jgi:hypothetical protein
MTLVRLRREAVGSRIPLAARDLTPGEAADASLATLRGGGAIAGLPAGDASPEEVSSRRAARPSG